jgi:hypothetical protein
MLFQTGGALLVKIKQENVEIPPSPSQPILSVQDFTALFLIDRAFGL